MNKNQKQMAIIGASLIALWLVYVYYRSRNSQNATSVQTPDTSGTDFATLAGQEQGDVAALQQQEQSDVADLQGQMAGFTSQVETLTQQFAGIPGLIAALSAGVQKFERSQTVNIKKGSAFYNYYKKVTGKAPPAEISATNFIYEAFKAGVSAANLKKLLPKQNHAGSKNHHIQHPNPWHDQQRYQRSRGVHQKPARGTPGAPGWNTKAKKSGRRK